MTTPTLARLRAAKEDSRAFPGQDKVLIVYIHVFFTSIMTSPRGGRYVSKHLFWICCSRKTPSPGWGGRETAKSEVELAGEEARLEVDPYLTIVASGEDD